MIEKMVKEKEKNIVDFAVGMLGGASAGRFLLQYLKRPTFAPTKKTSLQRLEDTILAFYIALELGKNISEASHAVRTKIVGYLEKEDKR